MSKRWPSLTLLLSGAVLLWVYGLQYIMGLKPCELCVLQRFPWWGIFAIALIFHVPPLSRHNVWFLFLLMVLFFASSVLALYHVGVEWHLWHSVTSCGQAFAPASTLEALRAQVLSTPVVRCDEVQWRLFGFSLAEGNALVSLVSLGGSIMVLLRKNVAS